MPPSRRQSRTTTSPVRRPKVAGLRRPSATTHGTEVEPEVHEPQAVEPAAATEPEVEEAEPATGYTPPVWREPEVEDEPAAPEPETDVVPLSPKPTGKRRATGSARPADLAEAEAEVGESDEFRKAPNWNLILTVGLVVLAVIFAGLAVWFRGEANSRSEGADTNNQALTDTARASEAVGQLRTAIEKSLTYNYTDLDSTSKAVKDNLAGKALCEYDQLFGQVQKLAPQQKLVLTTRVREIGITRLEGDKAELLVFVDQTTTRADQNQTTASGAQFGIRAEHQGDKWKITQFDMLGQPLPNGQPAPQC